MLSKGILQCRSQTHGRDLLVLEVRVVAYRHDHWPHFAVLEHQPPLLVPVHARIRVGGVRRRVGRYGRDSFRVQGVVGDVLGRGGVGERKARGGVEVAQVSDERVDFASRSGGMGAGGHGTGQSSWERGVDRGMHSSESEEDTREPELVQRPQRGVGQVRYVIVFSARPNGSEVLSNKVLTRWDTEEPCTPAETVGHHALQVDRVRRFRPITAHGHRAVLSRDRSHLSLDRRRRSSAVDRRRRIGSFGRIARGMYGETRLHG